MNQIREKIYKKNPTNRSRGKIILTTILGLVSSDLLSATSKF